MASAAPGCASALAAWLIAASAAGVVQQAQRRGG